MERLLKSDLPLRNGFTPLVPYAAYLQELRQSCLCLELPGQAEISERLVEAMALGAVVVARPSRMQLPEPLIPGQHYLPLAEDGSDVVDVCAEALCDPRELRCIAQEAGRYFDLNFSAESMARRILRAAATENV